MPSILLRSAARRPLAKKLRSDATTLHPVANLDGKQNITNNRNNQPWVQQGSFSEYCSPSLVHTVTISMIAYSSLAIQFLGLAWYESQTVSSMINSFERMCNTPSQAMCQLNLVSPVVRGLRAMPTISLLPLVLDYYASSFLDTSNTSHGFPRISSLVLLRRCALLLDC